MVDTLHGWSKCTISYLQLGMSGWWVVGSQTSNPCPCRLEKSVQCKTEYSRIKRPYILFLCIFTRRRNPGSTFSPEMPSISKYVNTRKELFEALLGFIWTIYFFRQCLDLDGHAVGYLLDSRLTLVSVSRQVNIWCCWYAQQKLMNYFNLRPQ